MSEINTRRRLLERRGTLLAELFLEELMPAFLARSNDDFGFDFLVGFSNSRGGINNIPVAVRATEGLRGKKQYPVGKHLYERLAYSNTPVLLLVVDAKENRLYYAWLTTEVPPAVVEAHKVRVDLTELDDQAKEELRHRLAT